LVEKKLTFLKFGKTHYTRFLTKNTSSTFMQISEDKKKIPNVTEHFGFIAITLLYTGQTILINLLIDYVQHIMQ
jgi:hypothetical protein